LRPYERVEILGGHRPPLQGISRFARCTRLSDDRGVQIFSTVAEASAHVQKSYARRVLVPTMGALHKAHLELIRAARENAGPDGQVAVSIFVNPLQFEPGSDYERYPRPEKEDEDLCRSAGVDLLFRPAPPEMYSDNRSTFVEETSLSQTLCGRSRPGHFRGVCTVVAKLFNILAPNAAVFGEKDFQQLIIIRRMVRDLNFGVQIVGAPIVREEDGLACSSRNQYLKAEERRQAPVLRASLLKAREMMRAGEMSAPRIISAVRILIDQAPLARIDYVDLVDGENLQPREVVEPNSLLAVAAFFGQTRLIDNIRLP
jgi:pantoate--beta-alanine ligase